MSYGSSWAKEKETASAGPMAQPHVVFEQVVWQKIMHWIDKAPGEVSGLGKIVIAGSEFRVVDAILVRQDNGSTSTELDPAAVAKAMFELRATPGFLNFWWHSHVDMNVFWSGTDIDTIREIGRNGFLISTVLNKKREYRSAFYAKAEAPLPEVFMDQLPTSVVQLVNPDLTAAWDREYEEKCKPKSYASSRGTAWEWSDRKYGYGGDDYGYGSYGNEHSKTNSDDGPEPRLLPPPPPKATPPQELLGLKDIEDLAEDMETEPNYLRARGLFNLIASSVAQIAGLSENEKSVAMRTMTRRFNLSRAGHIGDQIDKTIEKVRAGSQAEETRHHVP